MSITGKKYPRRGFGSMNPEKVRDIARQGGLAAHKAGTAHEWTRAEAQAAGRKGGGAASHRRSVQLAAASEQKA